MLIVRGRRVVVPGGEAPASIHIDRGRIIAVGHIDDAPAGAEVVDCGDLVVSPGIVDSHVHVNEPGRTEWEGFDTATHAAAAGGVTTIVDMPLNSIPATTTMAGLEAKRQAARGRCHVDVAFWGGVVPGNEREIEPLVDAGVRGFKCFLVPSGVDEFENVDEGTLRRVMPVLARRDVPLLVHAELPQYLLPHSGQAASYRDYEATRPVEAEVRAIEMMAALGRETGARVHIVHVSSAAGAEAIANAQDAGIRITGETCPHYLAIHDDEIGDGATEFKCAPPIRDGKQLDALWERLKDGTLSLIASDHSPAPRALKAPGDFVRAWGGIASLELSLPVVWTAIGDQDFKLSRLATWMSEGPAALSGLADRKGRIRAGQDADLMVWDPAARFTVDAEQLHQRHKITPYATRKLQGKVHMTFVRGERVWDRDRLVTASSGQLL